jgi:hypothetical protein
MATVKHALFLIVASAIAAITLYPVVPVPWPLMPQMPEARPPLPAREAMDRSSPKKVVGNRSGAVPYVALPLPK